MSGVRTHWVPVVFAAALISAMLAGAATAAAAAPVETMSSAAPPGLALSERIDGRFSGPAGHDRRIVAGGVAVTPVGQVNGPTCASGASPISFAGVMYCPGYIFAIRRSSYGTATPIVVRGVLVESVSGATVRISGGPSCLASEWCGQTVPALTVTFPAGLPKPSRGQIIDLFGRTTVGGLTPVGHQVTGYCAAVWDC